LVAEAEAPLECASRNPAMQVSVLVILLFRLAGHQQRVLLHGDVQLVLGKAGHRDCQAISDGDCRLGIKGLANAPTLAARLTV
jgi:hypothetical protein